MSDNNKPTVAVGPGLTSLLTVLFVGLKLTGHINWSWWWVLSPLWISTGLVVLVLLIAIIILLLTKKL